MYFHDKKKEINGVFFNESVRIFEEVEGWNNSQKIIKVSQKL